MKIECPKKQGNTKVGTAISIIGLIQYRLRNGGARG